MMAWLAGKFTIVGVLPSIIMANHLSLWKTINNLSIIADMWGILQQTIELMIATRGCYSQLGWGITSGIWSNLTDGNHGCYTPKTCREKKRENWLSEKFFEVPYYWTNSYTMARFRCREIEGRIYFAHIREGPRMPFTIGKRVGQQNQQWMLVSHLSRKSDMRHRFLCILTPSQKHVFSFVFCTFAWPNINHHPTSDWPRRRGTKMKASVLANLHLFSSKQQKALQSVSRFHRF